MNIFLLFILFGIIGIAKSADDLELQIISASDIHGWVYEHRHNDTFAHYGSLLSYIDHVRDNIIKNNPKTSLLVTDSGDLLQGTGLSDATNPPGKYIFAAAQSIPYDLLTTGNHDIGDARAVDIIKSSAYDWFKGNYVTTNTFINGTTTPLGSTNYLYRTLDNGLRVLMFGFMYSSTNVYAGVYVQPAAEVIRSETVQKILKEYATKIDLLLMANHIATTDQENIDIVTAFKEYFTKINYTVPIIQLTGHSHQLHFNTCSDYTKYNNKNQCFRIEPGWALKFFQHNKFQFKRYDITYTNENDEEVTFQGAYISHYDKINNPSGNGVLDKYKTKNLFSVNSLILNLEFQGINVTKENFETPSGLILRETIDTWVDQLDLEGRIGCAKYTYSKTEPENVPNSMYRLWLEAAFPAEVFNSELEKTCVQFPLVGRSSLRENLYKGEIILDDIYTIMPFPNEVVYMPSLTAEELACIDRNVNKDYVSNSYNTENSYIWVEEEPVRYNDLPPYIAPQDMQHLDPSKCYDTILTSYDIGRFNVLFRKGGACAYLARENHDYEGAVYPTAPNPSLTTDYILKSYITKNMICLSDGLKVKPNDVEGIEDFEKNQGEQRMMLLVLSIIVTILFVITYLVFIIAVVKLEKLSKRLTKKRRALTDTVIISA